MHYVQIIYASPILGVGRVDYFLSIYMGLSRIKPCSLVRGPLKSLTNLVGGSCIVPHTPDSVKHSATQVVGLCLIQATSDIYMYYVKH